MTDPSLAAYAAILAEARRLGIPKFFKTDLSAHDRRDIAAKPPGMPFIWAVYLEGTHIVWPDVVRDPRDRRNNLNSPASIVRCLADTFAGAKFYAWDGLALSAMDVDGAAEFISEDRNG